MRTNKGTTRSAKLTIKQEKFCLAYIKTGNASEAYRQSYDCKKSKPETVTRKAKDLIDSGNVSARIKELRDNMAEKFMLKEASILKELSNIIHSDVRTIAKDGKLLRIQDIDDKTASAISAIKFIVNQKKDGEIENVVEVRLWNKNTAIDQAAKILGLYKKDNEQKKPDLDPLGELISAIAERKRALPGGDKSGVPA